MADNDFTLGKATEIAHNCTVEVAGQDHQLSPSAQLEDYGITTGEQEDLVKKDVRTNDAIGVPAYGRRIDANALKDLTRKWTISKLRDVIYDNSEAVEAQESFSPIPADAQREAAPPPPGYASDNLIAAVIVSAAVGFIIGLLAGRRS